MNRHSRFTLILLSAALLGAAPSASFHVTQTFHVGGEGGWDYVTVGGSPHRIYLAHSTKVDVLDADTGKAVGEIPDTPGVHGVALAPGLNRGFVSDGRDSTVTIFDLQSLKVLDRVKLDARNPDAIAYDEPSKRVFTFNGGSNSTTAIDAGTGKIAGSLDLGGRPEFAVSDGSGTMFVNLEDKSELVAFDPRKLAVLHTWPIAPGEEPSGLAMDRAHRRLFAGCANDTLIVLDADKGTVVSVLPIGKGVDAVAFDPARALVFSSNGEGTLTVIHEDDPDHYTVLQNVSTKRGGRTLGLDPAGDRIYIPTAEFGPPPPPTADRPHPRPSVMPGTFQVLVVRP